MKFVSFILFISSFNQVNTYDDKAVIPFEMFVIVLLSSTHCHSCGIKKSISKIKVQTYHLFPCLYIQIFYDIR